MRIAVLVVLCVAVGAGLGLVLLRRREEPRPKTPPPTRIAVTAPPARPDPLPEPPAAAPTSRIAAAPFVAQDDEPEAAGPAEPESDEPGPYVRMRLLLPGGNPLPPADVRLYVGADHPDLAVTGASRRGGHWTFPRARIAGREAQTPVVRVVTDYRPWTAHVVVPAAPADADVDLGDVALVATPVVCAGFVVGPEGEPVVDARLVLEAPTPFPLGALLDGPIPDGTFRYFAETPPERVRLSATSSFRDPTTTTVDVPVGAMEFRIVLGAATGLIHGRVLVADDLPPNVVGGYSVTATGSDGVAREWPQQPPLVSLGRFDAPFRIGHLPVGKARVEIRLSEGAAPAVVLEDVAVHPGADAADPRLDPLDLRGRVFVATVTVVDPDGEPVADVASARTDGSEFEARRSTAVTDAAGTLTVVAERSPVEIDLRPPLRAGKRSLLPRKVRVSALQERVVLTHALDVRIALGATPGGSLGSALSGHLGRGSLWPRLVSESGAIFEPLYAQDLFDPFRTEPRAVGEWRFSVESPGRYALRWRVLRPFSEMEFPWTKPPEPLEIPAESPPQTIDVGDVATPQQFTPSFGPAARAALGG